MRDGALEEEEEEGCALERHGACWRVFVCLRGRVGSASTESNPSSEASHRTDLSNPPPLERLVAVGPEACLVFLTRRVHKAMD